DLQEQKGGDRLVIHPLNVVVPAQPFGIKLSWVRPQAPVRLSHAQKEIHHPCLSLRNQSPVGGWDRAVPQRRGGRIQRARVSVDGITAAAKIQRLTIRRAQLRQ